MLQSIYIQIVLASLYQAEKFSLQYHPIIKQVPCSGLIHDTGVALHCLEALRLQSHLSALEEKQEQPTTQSSKEQLQVHMAVMFPLKSRLLVEVCGKGGAIRQTYQVGIFTDARLIEPPFIASFIRAYECFSWITNVFHELQQLNHSAATVLLGSSMTDRLEAFEFVCHTPIVHAIKV